MKDNEKPIANPYVVLREEFDDWAILFNSDTGRGFGLSPTGVYVWKLLDGEHATDDLFEEIRGHSENVPDDAKEHIRMFIDALGKEGLTGLAAYDGTTESSPRNETCTSLAEMDGLKLGTYEPPKLIDFTGGPAARGVCTAQGSHGGSCQGGTGAIDCCNNGTCRSNSDCSFGNTADNCCYTTGNCATYSDHCHCTNLNWCTGGDSHDGCGSGFYHGVCCDTGWAASNSP